VSLNENGVLCLQIKLLKILALLGAGDKVASENMYNIIQQVSGCKMQADEACF
jgi:hypothetical protein